MSPGADMALIWGGRGASPCPIADMAHDWLWWQWGRLLGGGQNEMDERVCSLQPKQYEPLELQHIGFLLYMKRFLSSFISSLWSSLESKAKWSFGNRLIIGRSGTTHSKHKKKHKHSGLRRWLRGKSISLTMCHCVERRTEENSQFSPAGYCVSSHYIFYWAGCLSPGTASVSKSSSSCTPNKRHSWTFEAGLYLVFVWSCLPCCRGKNVSALLGFQNHSTN